MRTDDDPEVVREAEAMLLRVRDEVWLTLQNKRTQLGLAKLKSRDVSDSILIG